MKNTIEINQCRRQNDIIMMPSKEKKNQHWLTAKQHRHGSITLNVLDELHMCMLVDKGPLLLFVCSLICFSLW